LVVDDHTLLTITLVALRFDLYDKVTYNEHTTQE
jgi:hypothetical protein